jgi:NADPH-dependent 2,4-dienoyl-CoA reductase/sulfur reductase-like enzyme/nitrite reductase/ring-hydroxylating ferredoxin subunit
MGEQKPVEGLDFEAGVAIAELRDDSTVFGRVGDQSVLLSRRGTSYFAVGGSCTHYGGRLADGLIEGDHAHCPLHHACFNLRTGEALTAPAFDPLTRWRVDQEGEMLFVREKLPVEVRSALDTTMHPNRIVIVGGGAAGFAAAEMLRRRGFAGALTMLSADRAPPCDRPNLSKDYLAGTAPEDWIPLKGDDFYHDLKIDLRLGQEVLAIDPRRKEVILDGDRILYDALLLATGATPVRPIGEGFHLPNAFVLRSLADARAIIAATKGAHSVAILGASFIGLEAAASLRERGLEVHVIAPEAVPLQRVLGAEVGAFVRTIHKDHGVKFHPGPLAERFDGSELHLSDGRRIAADFVVLGVGVRPNTKLASDASLDVDNGVLVDKRLRTSDPAIFAAGDIARYFDSRIGEHIRVEHWVAAEQQGQAAAMSMLGDEHAFTATPFFWSTHFDHSIRYVGHAQSWDAVSIDGSFETGSFTARYIKGGRVLAAASLGRDRESLEIQQDMEREAAHSR